MIHPKVTGDVLCVVHFGITGIAKAVAEAIPPSNSIQRSRTPRRLYALFPQVFTHSQLSPKAL